MPRTLNLLERSTQFSPSLVLRGALCALLLGNGFTVSAQNLSGEPLYGSSNLSGGFEPDPIVVTLTAGGSEIAEDLGEGCTGFITASQPDYRINYTSSSYPLGIFATASEDTTLIVNAPDGEWHCSDDSASLDASNPGVAFPNPLSGQYDIWVGTYSSADLGTSANLVITELGESSWLAMDIDGADDGLTDEEFLELLADFEAEAESADGQLISRRMTGSLEAGDDTLSGYGYAEHFTFDTASADQRVIVDLNSSDFDTYLRVRSPSGTEFSNDDYEGSTERSLLSLDLNEIGTWEIIVTSFMSGQTGNYDVSLSAEGESTASASAGLRNEVGSLESSDMTLAGGEYADIYEVQGRPGQRLEIDLNSSAFDTYLILESPAGERVSNDDMDSTSRSYIDTTLTEVGTYQVMVTSFSAGSTGAYQLTLGQGIAAVTGTSERDVTNLTPGSPVAGELDASDLASADGKFEDSFSFQGTAGETVRVRMDASEFDTYLRLLTPDGQTIENDDFEGSTSISAIDLTLPETGRYRVIATSYSNGVSGSYAVSVTPVSAGLFVEEERGGGRIFGIFAGISDYPGDGSDLDYTDQDATRARDALIAGAGMSPDNAITLLNGDATISNFRSAVNRMASTVGPQDTFVIFYSGHGGRNERSAGPDSADPDGFDETIALHDGAVLDDELSAWLDQVDAGTTLLVMDSCFSGGFAKDIISRPGRMGLFSSEEDVTSQVASKFRAGGYLSVFFEEALEGYADMDENGELTALELSEYLHHRFRNDVKSAGADQYVRASGPEAGFQHLVVDRGGVGAYNVLFNHR